MTPDEARAILKREEQDATEKVKGYLHWRVQYRVIRGRPDTMPEDFFRNLYAWQLLSGKGDLTTEEKAELEERENTLEDNLEEIWFEELAKLEAAGKLPEGWG